MPIVLIIVIIVGLVILVIIIFDVVKRFIYSLINRCGLITQVLLPDKCGGSCATGRCGPTATRPYGPWGIFGTQDAACACIVPPPPPPPPGTSGGTGGGGSGGTSTSGSFSGGSETPPH
jgi:hypothetical protein